MPSRKQSLRKDVAKWLSGAERVVVAGIGNPIRKDDFVGVKVIQDLQGRVSDRVMLIECETVPEDYVHRIAEFRPTHVLLIDAALLDMKPGETQLVNPEKLVTFPAYSTHMLPLQLFCEQVAKATQAKICLLLLQPADIDFGEGLSAQLTKTASKVASVLAKALPGNTNEPSAENSFLDRSTDNSA